MWVGWALIYYSSQITQVMGRNTRAEKNLWSTTNAIILLWMAVIVLWILTMFGMFNAGVGEETSFTQI